MSYIIELFYVFVLVMVSVVFFKFTVSAAGSFERIADALEEANRLKKK